MTSHDLGTLNLKSPWIPAQSLTPVPTRFHSGHGRCHIRPRVRQAVEKFGMKSSVLKPIASNADFNCPSRKSTNSEEWALHSESDLRVDTTIGAGASPSNMHAHCIPFQGEVEETRHHHWREQPLASPHSSLPSSTIIILADWP